MNNKIKISIPSLFLAAAGLLSSCGGSSERGVHLEATLSGIDAGELVSCLRPAANPDSSETLTAVVGDGGKFTLDIPIAPGHGDWYRLWIGSTPEPRKEVLLYLDSGTVQISGKDGFAGATYSGNKDIQDFQDYQQALLESDSPSVTIKQWIITHPSAALGTALLDQGRRGIIPVDTVIAAFGHRSPAALANLPARRLKSWIQTTADVAPGKPAPMFSMPDTAGHTISLKDFRGKYVLLDFWASWCGPCRMENPNVVKAYQQYKDKNFTVLGVSLDQSSGKSSYLAAIRKDGLTWTHVSDLKYFDNAAAQQYHIDAIPANFLIDPQGVIIARNLRGEELQKKLAEILAGQ